MSNRYFEQDRRYGHTVWGKLFPAKTSRTMGGLPIGLAHGVMLSGAEQPFTTGDSKFWFWMTAFRKSGRPSEKWL